MEFLNFFNNSNLSCDEVYAAMDTNDKAIIVKAALNTLKRYCFEFRNVMFKSVDFSNAARDKGNALYKKGDYKQALDYYNKALAFAPNDSEQKILAYSNRSAVLFSIRFFTGCIEDIRQCLTMGCSKTLTKRLHKRLDDTQQFIHEELLMEMKTNDMFVNSFFHKFQFDDTKHSSVPCTIACINFSSEGITAKRDINVGSVVAMEKAFVTCSTNQFTSCYYCNQLWLRLHPCNGCCEALFCSDECMKTCMEEYHKIECQIVDFVAFIYDKPLVRLMTRSAIKLTLKLGWDKFIAASKNIGASRMRSASARETYNCDEPLSMLSYNDDKELIEGRMFNGSFYCATILYRLQMVPDYFPREGWKRDAAVDAMSRTMLHLYSTFTNTIPIQCSTLDFKSKSFRCGAQTNFGWFSMASKLKHSCEPNLFVVGLNDTVAFVALRTIKKGEDLTISYIEHFYDTPRSSLDNRRASRLFVESRNICSCRVCVEQWDCTTEVTLKMTFSDQLKWNYLGECQNSEKNFQILGEFLDVYPWKSSQHKLAYAVFRGAMNMIQSKQTNNKTYMDKFGRTPYDADV